MSKGWGKRRKAGRCLDATSCPLFAGAFAKRPLYAVTLPRSSRSLGVKTERPSYAQCAGGPRSAEKVDTRRKPPRSAPLFALVDRVISVTAKCYTQRRPSLSIVFISDPRFTSYHNLQQGPAWKRPAVQALPKGSSVAPTRIEDRRFPRTSWEINELCGVGRELATNASGPLEVSEPLVSSDRVGQERSLRRGPR